MLTNLLCDVDGVLLDWSSTFIEWAESRFGPLPPRTTKDPNFAHEWLGVDPDIGYRIIQEFQSTEALSHLPAYPDAVQRLRELRSRGFIITCVTTCGVQPILRERRTRNLVEHFGDIFSQIICLPVHSTKLSTLQAFQRGVWVDDATYHVDSGHQAGHLSFFMHRDQHPVPESSTWEIVRDWHDLCDQLIDPTPISCC